MYAERLLAAGMQSDVQRPSAAAMCVQGRSRRFSACVTICSGTQTCVASQVASKVTTGEPARMSLGTHRPPVHVVQAVYWFGSTVLVPHVPPAPGGTPPLLPEMPPPPPAARRPPAAPPVDAAAALFEAAASRKESAAPRIEPTIAESALRNDA